MRRKQLLETSVFQLKLIMNGLDLIGKKDAWFSVLMIWGYDIAWMVNESNECYKHPNEYLSGVQIKKTDWSSKSSSSGHNM